MTVHNRLRPRYASMVAAFISEWCRCIGRHMSKGSVSHPRGSFLLVQAHSRTPLLWAVRAKNIAVADMLLRSGANVNAMDKVTMKDEPSGSHVLAVGVWLASCTVA